MNYVVSRLFTRKYYTAVLLFLTAFIFHAAVNADEDIKLDFDAGGRMFEGIGALSAGASSRLLIDYSEPQRSQILDLLFKPKFGASLQHFKVEIGADINSTDGSEPCHARTSEELKNPKPEYYRRGYEWWLMKEAKKRNPDILLGALEWGCPGWCGTPDTLPDDKSNSAKNTKFFSQDNADVITSFITGMKKYHNLDINYCGIWNERHHNIEWIKLLRKTLDTHKLNDVKIVAADHNLGAANGKLWCIADQITEDPELKAAIYAAGVHYPERYTKYKSSDTAQSCGKPLWNSEGGPWKGDWKKGFPYLAKLFNRCYIEGKMTKVITWSLISSYYDFLALPDSGLMMAKTPWSGHYEVQPAVWAVAHTTQFTEPGWFYLDSASKLLKDGGSVVALTSPDKKDYSIIIETIDAKKAQKITFKVPAILSGKKLSVWRSLCGKESFIQQKEIKPDNGEFTVTLLPNALYSVTTTSGQQKGVPSTSIPDAAPFPFPFSENFDSYPAGTTPKYFSDMEGAFETAPAPDRKSICLKQVITKRGIQWSVQKHPMSYAGNILWKDYTVSTDIKLPSGGFAVVAGRVTSHERQTTIAGVSLKITSDGKWFLKEGYKVPLKNPKGHKKYKVETTLLLSGTFTPSSWNSVALMFQGDQAIVHINGTEVGKTDIVSKHGLAGIGCGYHVAWFDNISFSKSSNL